VTLPIFVYRCDRGHRFERLVPRDTAAPACPECGGDTRKVPAGSSLARGSSANPARPAGPRGPAANRVPIPWRGVVGGGPEKLKREVEFRQRLEAKAARGLITPGGPDTRPASASGEKGSGPTSPAPD
jgi:putative FmdB family regulatory protein